VSVDTLRADRLGCYGGPPDAGARICALGDAGTRFEWAFATSPTTSPSVASLLTSRWVPQHRVTQNVKSYLADEVTTLAEALRDGGYATAAFVSNPMLHHRRRLDQGFDHYDHRMTRRERNRPGFAERDARDTTDTALTWVRTGVSEPWFVWVHYQDPHGPYEPPGAPPARDRPREPRLAVLPNNSGRGGIPRYQALPGAFAASTYEARYLEEIRYLDAQLGRLLDGLDAVGVPPGVLLTADHGEAFGEDGYFFAHGQSAGLDQLRIPLLWRPPPGRRGASVVRQTASLVDVAPSLLRVAGIAIPEAFVGRPLRLERGDASAPQRALFAEASRQIAVIRGRDYYARDRVPGAATRADGHSWGDENPEIPPRSARLDDGPGLPSYQPAGGAADADLEAALARFIAEHPIRGGNRHDDVPPELRAQLEALGYTDED
jgi:arylsulfatase